MSDYYRDRLARLSQRRRFKIYYRGIVFYVDAVSHSESGQSYWLIGDRPEFAGYIYPCYSVREIETAISNYLSWVY